MHGYALAVMRAAHRFGVNLFTNQAEMIAQAVLDEYTKGEQLVHVRQLIGFPEVWDRPEHREYIRSQMRAALDREIAGNNAIPTKLPTETVVADPDPYQYGGLDVRLAVPVRTATEKGALR